MDAMMIEAKPIYGTFKELPQGEAYCTCCERDLSGHALRWLELDQRTNTYHDFRDVPEDRSQGWFPFGLTCAKKLVKQAQKKRERHR
jgi:hypothetical protein